MKRLALCLAAALALPMLLPATALAQQKIRVAIWDFENNSQGSWWFSNQLGPAVRNHIDTAFAEDSQLSERFSVVEREKLALIMKEQGLGAAGALDPKTAAQVGKMLGIKYIITGAVDSFSINNTKAGIGGIGGALGGLGGNMVQANAVISLRIIDTTTAERLVSVSADGEVKKGGAAYRGTGMSRDAEWGIASEAAEKASKALVKKFVSGNYVSKLSTGAPAVLEAKIIKVDGQRAWINMGGSSGVKVGDRFTIFKIGEELIDPDSGAKLGATEEKIGTAEVVESQEKFAVVTVTGKAGSGMVLRKSGT
jgi:curli biogenesis system outer membrane secretion channel CsgG